MTRWSADPMAVAHALNAKMTPEYLADDEGCRVAHMRMKMPVMISNRSIITCFYRFTKEDGTNVLMHSSRGNEALVTANASKIGKDVVGNMHINYVSWKAYEGGIELAYVGKMDPNGSIPDFIKNKFAARMTNNLN